MKSIGVFLLSALLASAPSFAADSFRHGPDIDRVKNWRAPDSKTLIIETYGDHSYRVKFFNSCIGIRSAETIAFVTKGTDDLDQFASIILPDGTRCRFESVTRIDDKVYTDAED